MTAFNEHQFEKKLQYLKDSQESIQSLSSWCLQHRQHHKKIVSSWLRVMKKVKVEHRLTLFYLANDVIQYSKRKNYEFVESWGTALQRATPMVREEKVKHKILRIFKIWNDRGVYDDTFVSDLCGLLSTQTKKTQPEPALVETEFQSSALFNLIRSCSELDNETDTRLRKLKESPVSVFDVDGICTILKDKRQGDDMVVEVDEGIVKMQAYVNALQKEIKERELLIEQLEQAQIYYSSQYGEAKIVCNAYRNFGNRVKQLKRKLDELIPTLKNMSPLPSPDVNAPSPSPDSDIDLPEERGALKGVAEEEGFTPEGQPIKTLAQDDSHSLDNCFTSFLGNAASLPFDLQKNLFGESSPRLALTPSPIHNLLEESGELPLLSLSSTSEGKPIEVISSRSKPDEGFSISDFFKSLSTNIPGLDGDVAVDAESPPVVSKVDSFSSLSGIMDSIASRYDYSTVATTSSSSLQMTEVASRYEYSAVITTPGTLPPIPPSPVTAMDSVSRYEYSAGNAPAKQQYEYPPVVMTPAAPLPPPPAADVGLPRYDDYTPAVSTNTIQAAASVPDVNVPRYDEYAPAITTPTVPPLPVKNNVPRYDEYTPAITTPNVPPPSVKPSVSLYDGYTPAISTSNVAPPPVKSNVSQYEAYPPTITTTSTMQPPPPIPEMMESAISRYEYPSAVTTSTPLQPPPLPPNLFPLDKYGHEEDDDAWGSKKDGTPSWSSKLPPKFPTWGDTPVESEWTPAMPTIPLDLDTPESPPMYEKEGFSDPVEYDEAGDVDHRTLVTLQLSDVDHRSLAHVGKKDVDHRPAGMRKKDVDHRNLISLTGSPLRDAPWARADQDYRTIPKPVAAVVPEAAGERGSDRDYRVPRPLGQELHDNVESVDMDLSDEDTLEPAAARRDTKPLVSFNITSPSKVLVNSPLHEKEDTKQRPPLFSAQRIPTIGGNIRNFRSRGGATGNNFVRPPPLPHGFRPAPLAPPPPPPSQFLNETDKFRTPPPQLLTSPPSMKHNAPNFPNRSQVRNNFSPHRNMSVQSTSPGPSTPTKNATLSYPNVKPAPQVKPLPSGSTVVPVSTSSTPTQTERTLTQVKPQRVNSPATTQLSQATTKQIPQQQNTNSTSSAKETQQPQNAKQPLLPSPGPQNSKPPQSPQNSKSQTPPDSKTVAGPQASQTPKFPQSPHHGKAPLLPLPPQNTKLTATQHSPSPQGSPAPPSSSGKPPATPTTAVRNTTKSPPVGTKPFTAPTTTSAQDTTKPPSFNIKPPATLASSPAQDFTKQPSLSTKPSAVPTSSVQNPIKPQLSPGIKPSATPTSQPVQNSSKPSPFGTKLPANPTSPVQSTTKPSFGMKSPVAPRFPMQSTTRPPLFNTKPASMPTFAVNSTKPAPFGTNSPSTSTAQNIAKPVAEGTVPPATPASPVHDTTKSLQFSGKPAVPPSPAQNVASKSADSSSPGQDAKTSPLLGSKSQSQPPQNTGTPVVGAVPPATPRAAESQNTSSATSLPATSTPSQTAASAAEPAKRDDAGSLELADVKMDLSQLANGSNVDFTSDEPGSGGLAMQGALKREHGGEPWMNDYFLELESVEMDMEPRAKVPGLSMPHRGRGRGPRFTPRLRPPQWSGPRRGTPPPPRSVPLPAAPAPTTPASFVGDAAHAGPFPAGVPGPPPRSLVK